MDAARREKRSTARWRFRFRSIPRWTAARPMTAISSRITGIPELEIITVDAGHVSLDHR